jgi:hypothetical protein
MTKKKEKEGLRSTNHTLPATGNKDDDDDSNFSTQSKYKKFTDFLKESKETKQRQNNRSKILVCSCWVCKILDSSTSVTNDETDTTTTATKRYEPYNIVSETGDSIFYDPLVSNLNDEEVLNRQQIYIAEDKIREIVQQDEDKLTKHFNGVNFNRIE